MDHVVLNLQGRFNHSNLSQDDRGREEKITGCMEFGGNWCTPFPPLQSNGPSLRVVVVLSKNLSSHTVSLHPGQCHAASHWMCGAVWPECGFTLYSDIIWVQTGLIFRDRKLSFCNKCKHKLVSGRQRIYNVRMDVSLRKVFNSSSSLTLTSSSLVQPGRSDLSSTIRSPPPSLKRSCLGASIASPLYFFISWLCTSWKEIEMSVLYYDY